MRKKFGVLTFGRGAPTERELKSSTYQVPFRLSEINAEQYRERVNQASDFLEGQSREMIGALEGEMRKAAEKLDFEKAAELRNMLEDLKRTTKPMRRFTRHSLPSAIDPVSDVQSLADALQLPSLPVVMECFDISNISTTHVVASMVCFRNGVPDKDNLPAVSDSNGAGTGRLREMAEVVRRRYSRVLLQAREANPEAAEFSQEGSRRMRWRDCNRLEGRMRMRRRRGAEVRGGPVTGSRDRRRRQRPAFVRVQELQRLGLHELPIIGSRRNTRRSTDPAGRCRCSCPSTRAPCVCCSGFATRRTASRTVITSS
jgi:excinuclease ABC subunit C